MGAFMRFWPLFLLVFLGQCVRSATPASLSPIRDEAVEVRAIPVALDAAQPGRTSLGALTYLGGWQLIGDDGWFGGLSSLYADGTHMTAITDAGGVAEFDVGRFGHISNAHIHPIPAVCGSGGDKADRDSESLAFDPLTGDWWIGLEGRNSICRSNNDFTQALGNVRPRAMADWPFNYGPETLIRLVDGRFVAIAEGDPAGGSTRPLLVFDRDPTDRAVVTSRLSYTPPEGFSPTDATQLPDGRLIIINRRFRPWSLFTAVLTIVDPKDFVPGATVSGREIARFEPPVITDNYEGIATGQEDGKTIIWLISDNNFASWQRNLLLKFAIDPSKLP